MSIDILHALPQMTHDEETGGYAYPAEYRNKLYVFKDQYVFIKVNSYDSFSKNILDVVLPAVVSANKEETDFVGTPTEETIKIWIESECANLREKIYEDLNQISGKIESIVNDALNAHTNKEVEEFIDRINNTMANFQEKFTDMLDDKVSIDSMTNMHEQLMKMIQEKTSISVPSFNSEGMVDDDHVKELIGSELQVVYQNMETIISEKTLEHLKTLTIKSEGSSPSTARQVSVAKLAMLKESGFSVEEIIQLVQSGSV